MILYFLLVLCNLSLVHLERRFHEDTRVDPSNNNVFNPINYTLERRSNVVSRLSPNHDEHVHYTTRFEGKIGEETNNGTWKHPHQDSFTFKIGGKQYFWGQSILDRYNTSILWFIHELLQDGRMGDETDHRMVADYYRVVFPFNTEGRQFFYGCNINTKVWFIRELLPGGRIGEETDSGSWNTSYSVTFPFTFYSRHYLYGHQISDGDLWFFKELLPNGKMGPLTNNEDIVKIHQRDFQTLLGYKTDDQNWFIKDLSNRFKQGLLVKLLDYGVGKTRRLVAVPFKIDGKQYFYEKSTWLLNDEKQWEITAFLQDPEKTDNTDHGAWNENYQVVVPYNIEGKQFLYFHSQETKRWVIRSLH